MWTAVVTVCMFGSSESWGLIGTHINGTHVPVEEPSTVSRADICNEFAAYSITSSARR